MHIFQRFDRKYTADIRRIPAPWRRIFLTISFFGEPVLIVGAGFVIWSIAYNRQDTQVEKAAFYAGAAYAINIILKLILHRRRPHGRVIKTFGLRSYSFPSGHAFGSVILYGLIAYIFSLNLARMVSAVLSLVIAVLVLLIGVSRVYLGSHYPSDVLAGWVLGLVSLLIVLTAI